MQNKHDESTTVEYVSPPSATYDSILAALVESSDDAIIGKTLDGVITSWNVAAERMFGYSTKEMIGKPISILVPKDGQEEFNSIMEKIRKDQRIEHFETKRIHKNGNVINVSVTLSPIKNKEGTIIGISKIVRNITEKKKSEQERIKLASIVESSEDAILGMNLDGVIDSWNSGASKMFGYAENEIVGRSVQLIYPSERIDELGNIIQKLKSGQRIEHFETERKRKDGSIIDVSLSISPIKNEKGNIVGIAKIIRDISGQKRTSAYARSLIEASLDPLVTISLEGKITDVNDATVKITGVPREKLIGSDFSDYFTEPEEAREGYQRVFNKGFVTDYPLSIRSSSGQITDVLYNASVYKDDKGKVLGVFAAARDVTETKKVSQYARSLIEASLDPLVTISPEGKITDVNDATVKITGVSKEKLIGSDFSDYFTEPEEAREGYQRVFNEGFVTDYPLSIRSSSGQITDVLYNASVYKDDKGKVLGVFAAARNVTERKKIEEQLHTTSAYARSLIEASLDPLVTISPEGKITDVNDATVKVTGVTREWLIGTDFSNYFTEPRKAREGYRLTFKEGSVKDYPLTIHHSSGQTTDVLYNASVYKNDKGKVLGVFAAARDVTETKKVSQFADHLFDRGTSVMELDWAVPSTDNTTGHSVQAVATFYGHTFASDKAEINSYVYKKITPLANLQPIQSFVDKQGNVIANARSLYSSFVTNNGTLFHVVSPSGVCVVGESSTCLVNESTLTANERYSVVTLDGANYTVYYSDIHSPLQRFSITSLQPITGDWKVTLENNGIEQKDLENVVRVNVKYVAEDKQLLISLP